MRTVECHLRMRILAPAHGAGDRVDAVLRYRVERPWEVELDFPQVGWVDVWVFGRDLLAAGLDEPAGLGDVRVWPTAVNGRSMVVVALQSPDGSCQLEARHRTVSGFLDRTYKIVPPGREGRHVDVDRALKDLLADPNTDKEINR